MLIKQTGVQLVSISMSDGTLAVMQFVTLQHKQGEKPSWFREATDEAIQVEIDRTFLAWNDFGEPLWEKQVVSWRRVSLLDMPTDRTFRDAWVDEGGEIKHDMNKARNIHLTRLRTERNQKLDVLDNRWFQAIGEGNTEKAASIEEARKNMRDMPELFADDFQAADDTEKLKAIKLDALVLAEKANAKATAETLSVK